MRRGWQWSPFVVLLLGPVLALVWAEHRRGWTIEDVLAAVSVAVAVSAALATLLDRRIDQRPIERSELAAPALSQERLEEWRVRLRSAIAAARVEQGGQLDQMVRYGEVLDINASLADGYSHLPRLSVGGRLLAWSEIKREWDESWGRMVILGDPGYGKTVAALTLVAHINESDEPGAVVAELFSLADWYLWQAERPGARLSEWLAEQLTLTYAPSLPLEVAQQLVAAGSVLPILDGLDEVPTVQRRRVCMDTIDSYTRRVEPHRPFVLTCRAEEYAQLAPDWVSAERYVVLAGLQPDQVDAILDERTAGRTGWDAIRARHASGDRTLRALFTSPLRLTLALQAFRYRDAAELLDLDGRQAERRLWDLLIAGAAETFENVSQAVVRSWLTFLATGMRRTDRQRFALHELYLIDPDRRSTKMRFVVAQGLLTGLIAGACYAFMRGVLWGLVCGLMGIAAGAVLASWGETPSTEEHLSWRGRVRYAVSRSNLFAGLSLAIVSGLITAMLSSSWADAAAEALFVVVAFTVVSSINAGVVMVDSEPPARFAAKRPGALLTASRATGLRIALTTGLAIIVALGLLAGISSGPSVGLRVSIGITLPPAFILGCASGLDSWLYYQRLLRRLSSRGHLPRHLPQFLDWCAEPSRGWLRVTDAYEFRHRELLDHLAPAPSSSNEDVQPDRTKPSAQAALGRFA